MGGSASGASQPSCPRSAASWRGRRKTRPSHSSRPEIACRRVRASVVWGERQMKHKILAGLLTLAAIAAAPSGLAQTAPDFAAIVAAPDRSDADRKLDNNRAPAKWLAFIGAKPGMKILDIFAVYGWKAELLARAVAPSGKVYAQNSEAAFTRVKDRLEARLKIPAAANIVSTVASFEEHAPAGMHDFDRV